MGDHVPAFLLREVPLPSRKKRDDDDAETDLEITEEAIDTEAPSSEQSNDAPEKPAEDQKVAEAEAADAA